MLYPDNDYEKSKNIQEEQTVLLIKILKTFYHRGLHYLN